MSIRRTLVSFVVVLVAGLGAAWVFGSVATQPHVGAVAAPKPPGRVVHLIAADGVRLEGSYWPGRRADGPAVLLLHGINSSRASFTSHALWLNRLGYAVLAIDFRGHGGSAAVPRSFGLY